MANQERGKRITTAIAVVSAAPAVLIAIVAMTTALPMSPVGWIISVVVPIVLSWLLVRGSPWLRLLTIFGFGFGGLRSTILLIGTLGKLPFSTTLVLVMFAAIQFAAAAALWLSEDVRAYFDRENQPATLNLSSQSDS